MATVMEEMKQIEEGGHRYEYKKTYVPEDRSWFFRHPTAAISIFGALLVLAQFSISTMIDRAQEPERKKTAAEIRGIRRDVRTMVNFQLESHRFTREAVRELAEINGIEMNRPPELEEAEEHARKLRNRR